MMATSGVCKALKAVVELANSREGTLEYVDALEVFMEAMPMGTWVRGVTAKGVRKCEGVTAKGGQCKRSALEGDTMCQTHKRISESPVMKDAVAKCEGVTAKGTRCKRNALEGVTLCAIHKRISESPVVGCEAAKCEGVTAKGARCKRKALEGATLCAIHKRISDDSGVDSGVDSDVDSEVGEVEVGEVEEVEE